MSGIKALRFAILFLLSLSTFCLRARANGSCPAIGESPSCGVLITINPNGSLTFQVDSAVGPYDGDDDTLVGIINKSGATVYGVSLSGNGIFGFDGDGICTFVTCAYPNPTGYEGPGTTFTLVNANSGTVNFTDGLANGAFLYFSLEGAPTQLKLSTSITIDPGHGTKNCPLGRTGATGPTNYPPNNPPPGHLLEYVLAYSIASQLRFDLSAAGYDVTMTKNDVTSCPTYAERTTIANNAHSNLFVSIHLDGDVHESANGSSGLYIARKTSSQSLAQMIVNQVSISLGTANRGTVNRSDLAVLKSSRMTSVLAEVATLTNVGGDEDIMHRTPSAAAAAAAIATGIQNYVNQ